MRYRVSQWKEFVSLSQCSVVNIGGPRDKCGLHCTPIDIRRQQWRQLTLPLYRSSIDLRFVLKIKFLRKYFRSISQPVMCAIRSQAFRDISPSYVISVIESFSTSLALNRETVRQTNITFHLFLSEMSSSRELWIASSNNWSLV